MAAQSAPQWTNGWSRFLEGTRQTGADPTWIWKTPSRYSGFYACAFDIQIQRRFTRSQRTRITFGVFEFSVFSRSRCQRDETRSFVRWKKCLFTDKEFFWSTDEQEINAMCAIFCFIICILYVSADIYDGVTLDNFVIVRFLDLW